MLYLHGNHYNEISNYLSCSLHELTDVYDCGLRRIYNGICTLGVAFAGVSFQWAEVLPDFLS